MQPIVNYPKVMRQSKPKPFWVALADESPVARNVDGHTVNEFLLVYGCEFRGGKDRIPLLRGDDSTVRNVVGSVTGLRPSDGKLWGMLQFASDNAAQSVMRDYDAGFFSHVEILHDPIEGFEVGPDAQHTYDGRVFRGPCVVITRWQPIQARLAVQ